MIQIDNTLVSLDVLERQFLCDLSHCKGICCVEGDSGAPLLEEEVGELEKALPVIWDDLAPKAQEIIKENSVTLDPSRVAAQVVSGIGFIGAGTIILQKQIVRGLTTAAGIWATAGIGLAVGAGMYAIGIATTVLTLIGLELLSYIFKSVGMKSSMISFSTNNKDTLKQIADRFNSKDYMIVSYEMQTLHPGEMESYQVTMVIKSKRNNDEGHLLSLMQNFPDVTVQRIE